MVTNRQSSWSPKRQRSTAWAGPAEYAHGQAGSVKWTTSTIVVGFPRDNVVVVNTSRMREVVLFAFPAALNPTLLTATTVMLLLRDPAPLMLGYWLGAMTTSVSLGLIIVFALQGSDAVSTTRHTLSPLADLALGALALLVALVLATDREPHRSKGDKGPPRWQRALSRGTARTTFVLGVMLTLPGASYLAGLT